MRNAVCGVFAMNIAIMKGVKMYVIKKNINIMYNILKEYTIK